MDEQDGTGGPRVDSYPPPPHPTFDDNEDGAKRSLPRRIARRAVLGYKGWRDPFTVDASRLRSGGRSDGARLVGFVKFYNEGRSGNLERCLRHMDRFCDDILACDNGSTDDSLQVARRFTSNIIIAPDEFGRELYVKQQMLEAALRLDPDWLVWLDPDEVFDRSGELGGLRALCRYGDRRDIDAFQFRYYNLWKSFDRYRTDEAWFENWQPKLWRNTGRLAFDVREGLHHDQFPSHMGRIRNTTTKLIHYGFSTDAIVSQKYENYKRHGQTGRMLERIRDESALKTEPFSRYWFPPSVLKVSVVCLIYKSSAYARFVHDSFERHTGKGRGARYGNVEFAFVANDPTDSLLEFLRSSGMRHTVFLNPDPNEYYMNRVYRAWNHGGMTASGDVLVFVNSDMAFTPGWLDNLLRRLDERTIVTSRLVESGKLISGKYGIERDFGTSHSNFDDEAFQEFAARVSQDEAKPGGLFMPCAIYADTFRKSGGYPIGNRTEPDGSTTSGDAIYFYETLKAMGVSHVTAFDSIVYHVQEGEKDE